MVARAHDHILWSRNQNYRPKALDKLLAKNRGIFEHFTHDASVLPMAFYPMWRRQFQRMEEKVRGWEWHRGMLDEAGRNAIKDRIRAEGPLSTDAFNTKVPAAKKKMWARPPHKLALDYMWYAGELSTAHRENFRKFYELSARVIPQHLRDRQHSPQEQINWLCRAALDRLSFGTEGEIQHFWDATTRSETKEWAETHRDELVEVFLQASDKSWHRALAPADIEARLANAPAPTSRLRILNPFDPAIRDRKRFARLFGFDYTIEMFVPAAKRKWGYYVYPLLEGDRFIGRTDLKADRKKGTLNVLNIWLEPGIKWTRPRAAKFEAELDRLAKLADVPDVSWECAAPGTG